MILHYILHQFCILQNWWLPGVTGLPYYSRYVAETKIK
jgi:hypothetical protein